MQDRNSSSRTSVVLSAIGYAVFFMLFMVWWTGSRDAVSIAMLSLCAVFNGTVWYWLFNTGTRWTVGRRKLTPRPRT
jgi:hypothetical protein